MISSKVGRIKNVQYNSESGDLEVTFVVTDPKFKKKVLRNLALSGSIEIKGEQIIFTGNIEDNK